MLLLLVVAFRLLLPPGLMLSPSTGVAGNGLAICSGHGALFDGAAAISTDPAAKATADDLANALGQSTPPGDHERAGDTCPFSVALALGLTTSVVPGAGWLSILVCATFARPVNAVVIPAPTRGLLGARAPPFATFA